MNIMQCQAALQEAGTRKRKYSNDEEFNYIFGITTTGSVWEYIMLTSENQLYVGVPNTIPLLRALLQDDDEELPKAVKKTVTSVAWMLQNRANAKQTSKRQCVQGVIAKPKPDPPKRPKPDPPNRPKPGPSNKPKPDSSK